MVGIPAAARPGSIKSAKVVTCAATASKSVGADRAVWRMWRITTSPPCKVRQTGELERAQARPWGVSSMTTRIEKPRPRCGSDWLYSGIVGVDQHKHYTTFFDVLLRPRLPKANTVLDRRDFIAGGLLAATAPGKVCGQPQRPNTHLLAVGVKKYRAFYPLANPALDAQLVGNLGTQSCPPKSEP